MEDDEEFMDMAYQRILETFQIRSIEDLQREALEKLVGGQDVYLIQPIGRGESDIQPLRYTSRGGTQNRAAEVEPKPNCETFELCWHSHR